MKKLLAIIFLAAALYGIYWLFFKKSSSSASEPKQEALTVKTHSNDFNQSVANALTAYLNMKDAFVEADSVAAKDKAQKFSATVDSIKVDELKKDTTGIYQSAQAQMSDIKANADAILKETDLTEMRQDFRMVSENLYPFLKTIHYEGQKLYWENCPMAFGENKEANWISNSSEIVNPYLGKKHPEYKATMLHCGEIKDTIK